MGTAGSIIDKYREGREASTPTFLQRAVAKAAAAAAAVISLNKIPRRTAVTTIVCSKCCFC